MVFRRKSSSADSKGPSGESGFLNNRAKPSVYHAVIVIFLEFFAWGLLTAPMLNCLQVRFLIISVLMSVLGNLWSAYFPYKWPRSRNQGSTFVFGGTPSWCSQVSSHSAESVLATNIYVRLNILLVMCGVAECFFY